MCFVLSVCEFFEDMIVVDLFNTVKVEIFNVSLGKSHPYLGWPDN